MASCTNGAEGKRKSLWSQEQLALTPVGHNSDLRWFQLTPLCFIKDLSLH